MAAAQQSRAAANHATGWGALHEIEARELSRQRLKSRQAADQDIVAAATRGSGPAAGPIVRLPVIEVAAAGALLEHTDIGGEIEAAVRDRVARPDKTPPMKPSP